MPQSAPPAVPTVTGHLEEKSEAGIVLRVLSTDYFLHLATRAPLAAEVGDRIVGTIHAKAKRVDIVPAGGRFVEPSMGRPRQIQGRITGGDLEANTLYVHAGAAFVVELMAPQKAGNFAIGQMVNFAVERGATFEPM